MVMIHRSEDSESDPDPYFPAELSPFNAQVLCENCSHTRGTGMQAWRRSQKCSVGHSRSRGIKWKISRLGYAALFDADAKRTIKEPTLAIDSPVNLFPSDISTSGVDELDVDVDVGSGWTVDVVREL